MFEFNPFDVDMDGDLDGMDFLGLQCLTRHVLKADQDAEDSHSWYVSCTDDEAHDQWDVHDESEDH